MCVHFNSADPDHSKGRKGTQTGDQDDLIKLALEQQAKLQQQKDDLEAARRAQAEKDAADAAAKAALGDGGDGSGHGSGDGFGDGFGDGSGGKKDGEDKNKADGDDDNKGKTENDDADDKKKRVRTGPLLPDTVIGKTAYCIVCRLNNV